MIQFPTEAVSLGEEGNPSSSKTGKKEARMSTNMACCC